MPGTYSLLTTVITGDTISASERNAEHTNHITNHDFSGMGDYSSNATEMQATNDPYPGSVVSLATTGAGELERIRYQILQLLQFTSTLCGATSQSYWYQDVSSQSSVIVSSGNVGLVATPSAGGGTGVVFLANASVAPTSNPTGGGILYCSSGALYFRGSSGTITPIALA